MYEFGIIIFPDDVIELAKLHNPSFFPLDCRVRGWRLDSRESSFIIDFETHEDIDERMPVEVRGDRLSVGGRLSDFTAREGLKSIELQPPHILRMLKEHCAAVPMDAELLAWQKWQPKESGNDVMFVFRLWVRTSKKEMLSFKEDGCPKDIRVVPAKSSGMLQAVGQRPQE